MGWDVGLEVPRVPQFAHQLPKPGDEREHGQPLCAGGMVDVAVVAWVEEVISEWRDIW